MAMEATGTPPGICTMESRASRPCREVASIGMPITGRMVCEAITPARCAAAPAPAIIILMPRPAAEAANFVVRSGVRCAEVKISS